MRDSEIPATPEPADSVLLEAVRSGNDPDGTAYAELHHRHHAAALRHARAIEPDAAAAEDLVADAFTEALGQLRKGAGPRESFRAYLLTSIRNGRAARSRSLGRTALPGDAAVVAALDDTSATPPPDAATEADLAMLRKAFASLPERWQAVLWHTEVEGDRPRHIAGLLGTSANGVSQLASRAREGLTEAYLGEHVGALPERCRHIGRRLAAHVRGTLGIRDRGTVDRHLAGCAHCSRLRADLVATNAHLRLLLPPALLGVPVAAYALKAAAAGGAAAGAARVRRFPRRPSPRTTAAVGAGGAVVLAAALAFAATLPGSPGRPPKAPAAVAAAPHTQEAPPPSPPVPTPTPATPTHTPAPTPTRTPGPRPTPTPTSTPTPSRTAPPSATPPSPQVPPPTTTPTAVPSSPPAVPAATSPPPPAPLRAVDDHLTVPAGGAGSIDILANDTGTGLHVTGSPVALGLLGSITCNRTTGDCTYTTYLPWFTGTDVFVYTVADSSGHRARARIVVTVVPAG